MNAAEVLAEAWRRSQVLDGWQRGPSRHTPLALPESLPAPIPPWWTEPVPDAEECGRPDGVCGPPRCVGCPIEEAW